MSETNFKETPVRAARFGRQRVRNERVVSGSSTMIFQSSHKPTLRVAVTTMAIAITASLALASASGARAQGAAKVSSAGDVEMMAAMEGMKPATDHMKLTGYVDRDFMLLMIPHHDAGIAMSSSEEGFGEHKDLKNMAIVDVSDQQKDNREMRDYLKEPTSTEKPTSAESTAGNELIAAMQKMNQFMDGMKLTGSQDHDFIMMMIPHHEAAITMSQIELKYGTDPRVKKVAQGVIDGQTKDVKDMNAWHKAWFGDSYPM